MDNQEIFNQIRELQKQRTLLSAQDTALVMHIVESALEKSMTKL